MKSGPPNWELLLAAAQRLTADGVVPFTMAQLIEAVQALDPSRQRASLAPIIQGMTANAPDGAPQSACGKAFTRIARGEYVLLGTPLPSTRSHTPPRRESSRPAGHNSLEQRLTELIGAFDEYAERYDREVPFRRSGQYELHRATIDRRRELESAAAAINDDRFVALLHGT